MMTSILFLVSITTVIPAAMTRSTVRPGAVEYPTTLVSFGSSNDTMLEYLLLSAYAKSRFFLRGP